MIIMRKAVASVVSGCTTGVPYTGTVYYSVLQNRAKADVRNYMTWKVFVTAPSVSLFFSKVCFDVAHFPVLEVSSLYMV